jgi:hypothetical protein
MAYRIHPTALVAFAAWLLAGTAFAQAPRISFRSWAPLGDYERTAFSEQGALRIVVPTRQRNVEIAFTPESVIARGYGAQRVAASGVRTGIAAPGFVAYTGRLARNSGRDFAKLGVSAEDGRLRGLLRVDGVYYALDADLDAGDYVIGVREADAAEVAGLARACGMLDGELDATLSESGATSAPPAIASATTLREIELGTEADAAFVGASGGVAAANAKILSVVNMVNGIYETDLGLTNRVVAQRAHATSDPYTTTDSSQLLDQFRSQFLSNVATIYDDALLFSGRNFDGTTVGVAFVDATCTPWRFGVVQMAGLSDFERSLVAAHELGHNLGARHSGSGIMTPSISGSTSFSQASRDEIGWYVGSVSCLALANQASANRAPVLDPIGPQSVVEGQTLVIQLAATDPDGDTLSYGATPLPVGASLSASGEFRWTPLRTTAACNGSTQTTVRFTASDGSLSGSESVPIAVDDANTNAAPQLADPADRSVYFGQLVEFQLQASDADGDSLTYSASGLPSGATFSASGSFSWTPTAAVVATPTFTATDCTGRSASQSVQLSASPKPAPHLAALSAAVGWYGDTLTLTGTDLMGKKTIVRIAGKKAKILSITDDAITLRVPKASRKLRDAGAQPVTVARDKVSADNVLAFDYVEPSP